MKSVSSLVVALVAAVSPAARAALGETPDQLEARYGKPRGVTSEHPELGYRAVYDGAPYRISVTFFQGKSQCEGYVHLDRSALTLEEAEALLKANPRDKEWKANPQATAARVHIWSSGDARADFPGQEKATVMLVQTKVYQDFRAQWNVRPGKEQRAFHPLLPANGTRGELLALAYPERLIQLARRKGAAIGKNQGWYDGEVRKYERSNLIPYDERLGLQREEYAEYLELEKKGMILKPVVALQLYVAVTPDGDIYLDGGSEANELRDLRFDATHDCIETPYGVLKDPQEVTQTAEESSGFNSWKGVVYRAVDDAPESKAEPRSLRALSVTLGKRTDNGRRFLIYRGSVEEWGVMTKNFEIVVSYA